MKNGWKSYARIALVAATAAMGAAVGSALAVRVAAQEPAAMVAKDDGLFAADSLELAATGYTFTEGPAWDGARIIFSDIPGDAVHVLTPGESAAQVLYAPSANANGHTFDRAGTLINAEHGSGAITRWTPEGGRQVIVDSFEGKRLNSPNDVVVRSDGLILFTDPPYGLGQRTSEVGFSGVFALDEATGRMVLIDDALSRPNGLALSPDEKVLYVGDTATQTVWAYDLAADGTASGKRLLVDVTDESTPGRVDGVRVDTEGRVWFTCPGGVCVVDPASGPLPAKVIDRLTTPKRATNLAWGGADLSELYITALTDVYRVKTRARGIGSSSRRAR